MTSLFDSHVRLSRMCYPKVLFLVNVDLLSDPALAFSDSFCRIHCLSVAVKSPPQSRSTVRAMSFKRSARCAGTMTAKPYQCRERGVGRAKNLGRHQADIAPQRDKASATGDVRRRRSAIEVQNHFVRIGRAGRLLRSVQILKRVQDLTQVGT
jgi:hypothetical protein